MDRLDKLHSKHLLPGFKDRTSEEAAIHTLSTSITSDFRSCQHLIRRIAELASALLNPTSTPGGPSRSNPGREELLMAANVQMGLAGKVQDLSNTFRKKQSSYLRLLRGPGTPSIAGSASSRNGDHDGILSVADDERLSQSLLHARVTGIGQNVVDQRTNEITSIAQSISDLADMFKDLSSLVIDQGTLLDRVDYNVEVLVGETKGAVRELEAATQFVSISSFLRTNSFN